MGVRLKLTALSYSVRNLAFITHKYSFIFTIAKYLHEIRLHCNPDAFTCYHSPKFFGWEMNLKKIARNVCQNWYRFFSSISHQLHPIRELPLSRTNISTFFYIVGLTDVDNNQNHPFVSSFILQSRLFIYSWVTTELTTNLFLVCLKKLYRKEHVFLL